MHIPDGFLSPLTCIVTYSITIGLWITCSKKIKQNLSTEKVSYLAFGAAFSFLLMMINIPIPGGTCGHAMGTALLSFLFGAEYAFLIVSIVLAIQALIFGDGGLTTYGANVLIIAFVPSFLAAIMHDLIKKNKFINIKVELNYGISTYVSVIAAALLTAILLGIQPYLSHNSIGISDYFPYALNISIPAVLLPHLFVFGIMESVITVSVLKFLYNDLHLTDCEVNNL